MYVCMYVYMYVCMYVCMYDVCILTYVCIKMYFMNVVEVILNSGTNLIRFYAELFNNSGN